MADPGVVLGLHRSRHELHVLTGALDLGVQAIDTSFNYRNFTSHSVLAAVAGDLLGRFTISTKIGFFPSPRGAEHSLDTARLRSALEQTNRDLGQEPDLVFLHNPERSIRTDANRARETFEQACGMLEEAVTEGMCRSWGIASWNPAPLSSLVDSSIPMPSVLMVRAGLLVGIDTLDATSALATQWGLRPDSIWGMSPFGGNAASLLFDGADPRLFLTGGIESDCSRLQAAFLAAYHLPAVSTVAVGTNDPSHLRSLLETRHLGVDRQKIQRYLELLRRRKGGQPR